MEREILAFFFHDFPKTEIRVKNHIVLLLYINR